MICIDFGSSETKILLLSEGKTTSEQIMDADILRIKTSILLESEHNFFCGDKADSALCIDNMESYIKGFNNNIGSRIPIIATGIQDDLQCYTAQDLLCRYFSKIRDYFDKKGRGLQDTSAVLIATPANCTPAKLSDLKKSAELSGFSKVFLCAEHDAAGYFFQHTDGDTLGKEKNILMTDWGEHALKLSILCKNSWGKYALSEYNRVINSCGCHVLVDAMVKFCIQEAAITEDDFRDSPQMCMSLNRQIQKELKESFPIHPLQIKLQTPTASLLSSISPAQYREITAKASEGSFEQIVDFLENIPEQLKTTKAFFFGAGFYNPWLIDIISNRISGFDCRYSSADDVIVKGLGFYAVENPNFNKQLENTL